MNGKYYGLYDMKRNDECVGVFEGIQEICDFFGGIRRNRVECAICRKNPLAFGSERYWVEAFDTITKRDGKAILLKTLGHGMYKVVPDGVFARTSIVKTNWHFFAAALAKAAELCR
jgi:hypothetical protein